LAKTKTKKKAKGKTKTKGNEPQIIVAKGGLTAAQFLKEVNMKMDNPLSGADLRDFQICVEAVVEEELGEGNPVNLFGLVKIKPRLHTKGERMVSSVFGDPTSPKKKKTYKAKITLAATQGIFTKKVKDALPSVQKLSKNLGA